MSRIIVDAGPLVAFLVKEEDHHLWVKEQFQRWPAPFITCEPVLTETFFLVRRLPGGLTRFFALLNSGLLQVNISVLDESVSLGMLVQKYADVPMSLADACLVRLAELHSQSTIFTLDGDFRIYRRNGREPISSLLPPIK